MINGDFEVENLRYKVTEHIAHAIVDVQSLVGLGGIFKPRVTVPAHVVEDDPQLEYRYALPGYRFVPV